MGAGIGAGLGLLLGAGLGYERQKKQSEFLQENRDAAFTASLIKDHPEMIETTQGQEAVAKHFGKQYVPILQQLNEQRKQHLATAQQKFFPTGGAPSPSAEMIGGAGQPAQPAGGMVPASASASPLGDMLPGGMTKEQLRALPPDQQAAIVRRLASGGTAGAMPAAAPVPTAGPQDPQRMPLETLRSEIEDASKFLAEPENLRGIDPEHIKLFQKRLDEWQKVYDKRSEEERKPEVEARTLAAKRPEEVKTATAKAEAERPIKIETTKEEAEARLGVEFSDAAIQGAAKKAAAQEAARRKAAGEAPLTPQEKQKLTSDAVLNRSRALAQAKTILSKPNRLFPGVTVPSGAVVNRMAGSILIREGLNPDTAFPLREGDAVTDPVSGKKVIWHESR